MTLYASVAVRSTRAAEGDRWLPLDRSCGRACRRDFRDLATRKTSPIVAWLGVALARHAHAHSLPRRLCANRMCCRRLRAGDDGRLHRYRAGAEPAVAARFLISRLATAATLRDLRRRPRARAARGASTASRDGAAVHRRRTSPASVSSAARGSRRSLLCDRDRLEPGHAHGSQRTRTLSLPTTWSTAGSPDARRARLRDPFFRHRSRLLNAGRNQNPRDIDEFFSIASSNSTVLQRLQIVSGTRRYRARNGPLVRVLPVSASAGVAHLLVGSTAKEAEK